MRAIVLCGCIFIGVSFSCTWAADSSTMPATPTTRPTVHPPSEWDKACEAFRISEIRRLTAQLASDRESVSHLPPATIASGRAALQAKAKLLAGYRNKTIQATPPFNGQIDIGSMGRAPNVRVIQIINAQEAIVHLEPSTQLLSDGRGGFTAVNVDNFEPPSHHRGAGRPERYEPHNHGVLRPRGVAPRVHLAGGR
jgi:hypothetical protein